MPVAGARTCRVARRSFIYSPALGTQPRRPYQTPHLAGALAPGWSTLTGGSEHVGPHVCFYATRWTHLIYRLFLND